MRDILPPDGKGPSKGEQSNTFGRRWVPESLEKLCEEPGRGDLRRRVNPITIVIRRTEEYDNTLKAMLVERRSHAVFLARRRTSDGACDR